MDPNAPIVLSGQALTPAEVTAVARNGASVVFPADATERLARDRTVVEQAVAGGEAAYGLTTGLGSRVTYELAKEELAAFSERTVRGRANGVGPPLSREVVRATVVTRCNQMAHGGSGVRPPVAQLLVEMLNRGVHPVVPETGSTGVSDLCLLAHIGLVVFGEGFAEVDSEVLSGADALARVGLEPVRLGPKDGLALCSSNAVAAGTAALVYNDASQLLEATHLSAALSFEAFRANMTPLDERAQKARPAPGQACSAQRLLGYLDGGLLRDPGHARRLQDPISFRCVSQVHGAFFAALDFLRAQLEAELNGAGDNPLVVARDAVIISTGNFHTAGLALALDTVAGAICQTAGLAASRTARLLSSAISGLPDNLSSRGPASSGFAPLLKTVHALVAELRHLAAPVASNAQGEESEVEDDATNAALAARRDAMMLDAFRRVIAIEALVAAQGLELAAPERVGRGALALQRTVRSHVSSLGEDRPCGPDVSAVEAEVLGPLTIAGLLENVRDA